MALDRVATFDGQIALNHRFGATTASINFARENYLVTLVVTGSSGGCGQTETLEW